MLPRLLVITNSRQMQPDFETVLEAALRGGARLIQLREKDLAPAGVLRLAQTAQQLCEGYSAHLLINSHADIAAAVGAGVHLPENGLSPSAARAMLSPGALCGVSVHSVESALSAAKDGADYLIFGSVFPTASHPGEAPQGIEKLHAVVAAASCPVFAVGGVTAATVNDCLQAGAHGVAAINAAWSTPDVAASVRELLSVLGKND